MDLVVGHLGGMPVYLFDDKVFCECGKQCFQINPTTYVCSCGKIVEMGV